MNKTYRTIWSKVREALIVVSEIVTGRGGSSTAKVAAAVMTTFLLLTAGIAYALPSGGQVAAGQVVISAPTTQQMNIKQSTNQAIVNWNSFGIGKGETVKIAQPTSQSTLLNRVMGNDPSGIYGSLTANGRVFLINPSGIIFGAGSRVDAGGFVASTLNMNDDDFMAARYRFNRNGATGSILNQGTLTAADRGFIALLAPEVRNEGIIAARLGTVALAAGEKVTLNFSGEDLINVAVDPATMKTLIENKHLVQADGGRVIMSASAADNLYSSVINNSGEVRARGIESREGRIFLDSGAGGETTISGILDTSSADGKGGSIIATGERVLVQEGAHLTASGATGGGEVLVGGSWQGGDSSIRQATEATVEKGTLLEANATDKGDGGTVVLWSNVKNPLSVTRAYGAFEARGGANGGDGGRIETSGHRVDIGDLAVNTLAAKGNNGLWLIDPYDFTVANIGGDIASTTVQTALSSGNVEIKTLASPAICTGVAGCGVGASGSGDIRINDSITWTANKLSLIAYRDVNVNASLDASAGGALAVAFGQGSVDGVGAAYNVGSGVSVKIPLPSTVDGTVSTSKFEWKKGSSDTYHDLVLNNGYLRFGPTIDKSAINALGQLDQPYYYDNVSSGRTGVNANYFKLTFSSYPLDLEIGEGTGGSRWNGNSGFINTQTGFTPDSGFVDISQYRPGVGYGPGGGVKGSGILVSTINSTVNGSKALTSSNTYMLDGSNSFLRLDTTITAGSGGLSNVGLWVGTRDDYVAITDRPTKRAGNFVNDVFTPISTTGAASNVLKIDEYSSGSDGASILFYSTNAAARVTSSGCCSFTNATEMNPTTTTAALTGDGSYALYINFGNMAANASSKLTWYYAAAPAVNIAAIAGAVAVSASQLTYNLGSRQTVTYNGSPYSLPALFPTATLSNNGTLSATTDYNFQYSGNPVTSFTHAGTYSNIGIALVSGFTGSGLTANITLDQTFSSKGELVINPKYLDLTGYSVASSKTYDGTTSASYAVAPSFRTAIAAGTGTSSDGKPYSGDVINFSGSPSYNSPNVATASSVSFSSLSLDNPDYRLIIPEAVALSISQKALTATVTAPNKIYDGTNTATPTLSITAGLVSGETVTATGTGTFNSKDVASANLVTVNSTALANGTGGGLAGNYSLVSGQTVAASITPKTLTMSGLSVSSSKVYNGTTAAVVTDAKTLASEAAGVGTTSDGKYYNGDTVSLTGTAVGTYNSKDVATASTVTYSGLSLSGGQAGNYSLTIQTPASATITRLNSVTWTGAATGNWFDPANWGGAVPDLANVANVVIPTGATISFNNASVVSPVVAGGTVSLDGISASGTGGLSLAAGTLAIANNLTLGSFSQSGGALTVGGNASIGHSSAALAQSGGTLAVTGATDLTAGANNISLTSAGNNFTGGVRVVSGNNLSITDTNALVLGNAAGMSTISGNLVAVAAGNIIQSGALTVNGTSSFTVGANAITLDNSSNNFTGAVGLSNSGSNNVSLRDTNDLVLGTVGVGSGTLTVQSGGALSGSSAITTSGAVTLNVGSGSGTLSGILSSLSSLTKTGSGTLTLSGANNYTGATTILDGTLSVATIGNGGVSGNLGAASNAAANLVLGGGTLQYTGASASTDRNFTLTAGTISSIDVTINNLTLAGASTATTGALTKIGNGTLTLSGVNNYTGSTTISVGTLALDATGTIAASSGLANAGTFTIVADKTIDSMTGDGATILGGILTIGDASNTSGRYSGIASGTGGITKVGTGTLTLSGANSYSGATTLSEGILNANTSVALGNESGTNTLVFTGGSLQASGTISSPNTRTVTLTSTGVIDTNGNNVSIVGVVSGSGGITKTGSDTLSLSGVNTYSGTTTVNDGVLSIAAATGIGSGSVVLGGGTLAATGDLDFASRTVTVTADSTLSAASNKTISAGVFSASGHNLALDGGGNFTLTNIGNDFGTVTIPSAATVSLKDADSLTLGASAISGNLTVEALAGALTVSGNISKSSGAEATATLKATGNILQNSGTSISSNNDKLNTVFWSDTDGNNSGRIAVNPTNSTAVSITTNGGGIWMGGGSGADTWMPYSGATAINVGNGYAVSADGGNSGVSLVKATLNAGMGNVYLAAKSSYTGSSSNNYGVYMDSASAVTTTGTGTISITGIGGGSTGSNNNDGVRIETTVQSASGAIAITGTMGLPGSLNQSEGIALEATADVTSTNGSILLQSDTLWIAPAGSLQSADTLTVQPLIASTTIGVGSGSGTLSLPSAYFTSNFVNGFSNITIGRSDGTGALSVNGLTFQDNLTLLAGGANANITLAGTIANSGAVTSSGSLLVKAGGHIAQSGSITTQNQPVILWSDGDGSGVGAVWLGQVSAAPSASSITTNGGHLWIGGGSASATPWNGLTVGNGYATGDSTTYSNGIMLNGVAISTGDGNIALHGKSTVGAGLNPISEWITTAQGIRFSTKAASSINSGTGTIVLDGVGRSMGTGVWGGGVELAVYGAQLSHSITSAATTGDAITITGDASSVTSGSPASSFGMLINWGSSITATGGGNILLTGMNGTVGTISPYSQAIYANDNSSISINAGAGNLTLIGRGDISVSSATLTSSGTTTITAENVTQTTRYGIAANNTGNDFSGNVLLTGAIISVTDANAIVLDNVIATGTLTVETKGGATANITQATGKAISATGLVTLTAGASATPADITLANAGNDFENATSGVKVMRGKDVSLTDANAIVLDDVTTTGTLAVETKGGATANITQVTGKAINAAGLVTLTAGASGTEADVTLANVTNDFKNTTSGVKVVRGKDVSLTDANAIELADVTTTGNAQFATAGAIDFSGIATIGGNLIASSLANGGTGAAITDSGVGKLLITGTSIITAGASSITLDNVANDFVGAVTATSGATSIKDANALTTHLTTGVTELTSVGALTIDGTSGNLTTTSAGLTFGAAAATVSGNMIATSSGAVDQTGVLTVSGTSNIAAGTNSVTLANAANDFVGVLTVAGGVTSIKDANALTAHLTTGVTALTAVSTLKADGTSGDLTTTSAGLTFGDAAATVSGNLIATSIGAVDQTGLLTVSGTSNIAAGTNSVTLANAANDFGGALTVAGGATSIKDRNALTAHLTTGVTALTAAGALTLDGTSANLTTNSAGLTFGAGTTTVTGALVATSTGAVSQTGAVTVTDVSNIAAGNNSVTLADAANDFGGALTVIGGATNVKDANALTAHLTTGITGLTAVGALTLDGTSGDLTTNSAGLTFGVGTTNVAGALATTSTGAVGQTGTVTVADASSIAAGSNSVILADTANDFGGALTVVGGATSIKDKNTLTAHLTTGVTGLISVGALTVDGTSGALTTNSAGLNFGAGATTVTGTLAATSTGAVSQTGAVMVTTTSNIAAGSKSITLADTANDFGGLLTLAGGATSIKDKNDLTAHLATGVTGLTSGGVLTVDGTSGALTTNSAGLTFGETNVIGELAATSTGAVGQTGIVTVTDASSITAGTNSVTLANAANDFGGALAVVGGATSIKDKNDLSAHLTTGVTGLTAVGALTLDGTSGDLTTNSASLTFGSAVTTVTGKLAATSSGAVGQTGAVTVTTTSNIAAGSYRVTLNNTANDFGGVMTVVGGATSIKDRNVLTAHLTTGVTELTAAGALTLDGTSANLTTNSAGLTFGAGTTAVTGVLAATSSGAVNQTGALTVTDTSNIAAGTNSVTLADAANDFGGALTVAGGATSIKDKNTLTAHLTTGITGLTAVGSLMLDGTSGDLTTNSASLTFGAGTTTVGGALAVTTTGAVGQTGTVTVTDASSIAAGSNSVTLADAANDFGGALTVAGGATSIKDKNSLTAHLTTGATGLTAVGALTVDGTSGALTTNSAGLTFGAGTTTVTGALATSSTGAVSQTGAVTVTTTSNIAAGSNSITLADTANDFSGLLTVAGGATSIKDKNDLTAHLATGVTGLTSGGVLTVDGTSDALTTNSAGLTFGETNVIGELAATSTGAVGQTGIVTVTDASSIAAGTNSVNLANAANDFGGALTVAGGSTSIKDKNDLSAHLTTGVTGLTAVGALTLDGTSGDLTTNSASLTFGSAVTTVTGKLAATSSGAVGQTGAVTVTTTSNIATGSNRVTLNNSANDFGGVMTVVGGATSIKDANSLTAHLTTGATDLTSVGALTIDGTSDTLTTNSAGLTFGDAATTVSGILASTSTGAAGQTGVLTIGGASTINAGTNNVTLNNIGNDFKGAVTLTGGAINILDQNGMTLNSVHSTGAFNAATLTGDLILNGAITSTNSSSDAVTLNAGRNSAAGTAAGGNIIISGGSVTPGPGGRATLLTGSVSGSTGLTSMIGSGSGNFLYNSDETATNYTVALGAGAYAVYREQPRVTVTADNGETTYNGLGYSGGAGLNYSGFVNGDTSIAPAGALTYGGSSQGATNVGNYVISPSSLASGKGYALSYSDGSLTVNPAPITITANDASKNAGQTATFTGAEFTASGLQNNETIGSVSFASEGSAPSASATGSPYSIVPGNPVGGSFRAGNYIISYSNGKLTVIPVIEQVPSAVTALIGAAANLPPALPPIIKPPAQLLIEIVSETPVTVPAVPAPTTPVAPETLAAPETPSVTPTVQPSVANVPAVVTPPPVAVAPPVAPIPSPAMPVVSPVGAATAVAATQPSEPTAPAPSEATTISSVVPPAAPPTVVAATPVTPAAPSVASPIVIAPPVVAPITAEVAAETFSPAALASGSISTDSLAGTSPAFQSVLSNALAQGVAPAVAIQRAISAAAESAAAELTDSSPAASIANGSFATSFPEADSPAFQAALSGLLAKGVSPAEAMRRAANAAAESAAAALTDSSPAASIANGSFASSPAAASPAFQAALSSLLAKGISPAEAMRRAANAAAENAAAALTDSSPAASIANGSFATSSPLAASPAFQATLSSLLAKGFSPAEAMQRAEGAALAETAAIAADAKNPMVGIASGNQTFLEKFSPTGDISKGLGSALARGVPLEVAIQNAMLANAAEQQAIKNDAASPLAGFSSGNTSLLPKGSSDFDKALTSAINRGLAPAEAIVFAQKVVAQIPADAQTPATALATGKNVDTILGIAGTSPTFEKALGNAVARGMSIPAALAYAKRVEAASALRLPVPANLAKLLPTGSGSVAVTTVAGKQLPGWMRYDTASKSFIVVDAPSGALPMEVAITAGGSRTVMRISENNGKRP